MNRGDARCPCNRELASEADMAHGVCRYCRIDAKKKPRRRPLKPDFVDVPMPGMEEWGEGELWQ